MQARERDGISAVNVSDTISLCYEILPFGVDSSVLHDMSAIINTVSLADEFYELALYDAVNRNKVSIY
jgi:hypothetical protein